MVWLVAGVACFLEHKSPDEAVEETKKPPHIVFISSDKPSSLHDGQLHYTDGKTMGACDVSSKTMGPCDLSPKTTGACDVSSKTTGACDVSSKIMGPCDLSPKTTGACDVSSKTMGVCDVSSKTMGACDMSSKIMGACDMNSKTMGPCDVNSKTMGPCDMSPKTMGLSELSSKTIGPCDVSSKIINLRTQFKNGTDVYVFAKQGKSRLTGLWNLDSLVRSCENLEEVGAKIEADINDYVIPAQLNVGLKGQIIVLHK